MSKSVDITGKKFGKLTAIKLDHVVCKYTPKGGIKCSRHFWFCKCECGNTKIVEKGNLIKGTVKSCGCLSVPDFKDIVGKKYGTWTVLKFDHSMPKIRANGIRSGFYHYYLCKCDCGNIKLIRRDHLPRIKGKFCRCLNNVTSETLHTVWTSMKQRCLNPRNPAYFRYGARGITVYEEWKNYFTFRNWAMANGYKDDLTIDRIDNNGNYEPYNCRWVDMKKQARNTRRNHLITYKGATHCISEWAEIIGMKADTLWARLKRGWSVEKSLLTPLKITRRWSCL